MSFTLATWNINSVRLREPLVCKLLREEAPDAKVRGLLQFWLR